MRRTVLAALVIGVLAAPALAQHPGDDPNTVRDIIERLTRGIRIPTEPGATAPLQAGGTATSAATVTPGTTAPPGLGAVSLVVVFPTGSARLTPDSTRTLDLLGQALASPDLVRYRFRIEGHTDTVGAETQNRALSERRAQAVRSYLAQQHRIAARRLDAVGLGEAQPLIATADEVEEPRNRRVQVINLGE